MVVLVPLAESTGLVPPIDRPAQENPYVWTIFVVTMQSVVLSQTLKAPKGTIPIVSSLPLPLVFFDSSDIYSISSLAIMATVFISVKRLGFSALRSALVLAALITAAFYFFVMLDSTTGWVVFLASVSQACAIVAFPAGIGAIFFAQHELRESRAAELRARERERQAHLDASVNRERAAFARELHDIAAHHMSGIAVMASAIEKQIDTAPDAAREGAQAIRNQSRIVLDDLRRLVGLLRETGDVETGIHSVKGIESLVNEGPVSAVLEILPHKTADLGFQIGPLGQSVAYRTVQEALTNAARHAPGASRCVVVDDRDDFALQISINNSASKQTAQATSHGYGLRGMEERAELFGAYLKYGATQSGGWGVELRLPRDTTMEGGPNDTGGSCR